VPDVLRISRFSRVSSAAEAGREFGDPVTTVAGLHPPSSLEQAAGAAIAATALLAVSIVMSIALLVPINNRSASWTADDHPGDWREQQQRWDRLHYARVAIIVAAFMLTLVAATAA
jgi:hypothetical protein